ncbi:uncharacterized protein CC84DRAFT_1159436 [Paraphaeosphaeria sporulosa]|uniref:Uncharacterized protein n=1 Tax=Paraphaeosphaeria sporulosa TaxID=1460663 RepID=A0A177CXX0_9PLEO|nr:uncharacterized protein CC84DRAFT_1159436 [Paraphaeosphaeria sporulosa]OAG12051.1 hypothetical protein CC84DRAFT_1159436 [Paraphaeosphaeria sporulosa]
MSVSLRWRRFWQSDKANAAEDLEQWMQRITQDEIRLLFLKCFIEGNNLWSPVVRSVELQYFQTAVSRLEVTPDGQIQMSSIICHLEQMHKPKSSVIRSAASLIEALITAHAHFPFSAPVKLTEESFCRSILLLTNRAQDLFEQSESGTIGGIESDYICKRPGERRLMFIHSALLIEPAGKSTPDAGITTQDDVLDVLCRVEYPAIVRGKDRVQRRPVSEFVPLAERLEPATECKREHEVPKSQVALLRDLITIIQPRWTKHPVELGYVEHDSLTSEEFVLWATKVQLLDTLDQLFSVFLRPPYAQGKAVIDH